MYRDEDHGRVMVDVARYGIEHRNMMSLTPLMLAASVGNVRLVESLLDRGARLDAVDTFGRMALHFALRSAFRDPTFARERLGSLYDALCPTGLDLEVDGRLVRLARNQGEFFVLATMLARFQELYGRIGARHRGFSTSMLEEESLSAFPRSVVPDERRRRMYWNSVLARAEVSSTYRPARKLWRRERQGNYVPSDTARLRVMGDDGRETMRALLELLRVPLLDGYARHAS